MYKIVKRLFDLCSSLVLLVLISPLFLVLMIIVLFNVGFPIFFIQLRSGKKMKTFKLIKFRTMKNIKNENGVLLPDEQRMTKFGNWLRSTSLDELPELINIIIGNMSVIGPRPLPISYNSFYHNSELARFNVRGGLITPDSIDDSPFISWDKQFEYEKDYANNLSFKRDLKIFINVFKILCKRKKTEYGSYIREPLDVERKKNGIH